MFVLDASIVLTWCFKDERTPLSAYVLALLDHTHALAPALLPFEVVSGVMVGEQRGRVTAEGHQSFLGTLAN